MLLLQHYERTFFMRNHIISVSHAVGLFLSGLFPFPASVECFLPGFIVSPAITSEQECDDGGIVVLEAQEVEFDFFLIDLLKKLF